MPGPKRFILNVLTRADAAIDRAKSPNDRITVHAAKVPAAPIFEIGRGSHVETIVDDSVKDALKGLKGWAFQTVGGAPKSGAKSPPAKAAPVTRVKGSAKAVADAWRSIEAKEPKTKRSLGLAKGATDAAIAKLERTLGVPLPGRASSTAATSRGSRPSQGRACATCSGARAGSRSRTTGRETTIAIDGDFSGFDGIMNTSEVSSWFEVR